MFATNKVAAEGGTVVDTSITESCEGVLDSIQALTSTTSTQFESTYTILF